MTRTIDEVSLDMLIDSRLHTVARWATWERLPVENEADARDKASAQADFVALTSIGDDKNTLLAMLRDCDPLPDYNSERGQLELRSLHAAFLCDPTGYSTVICVNCNSGLPIVAGEWCPKCIPF